MPSALEVASHKVKRVAQTPRAFSNWPSLLSGMLRETVGRGPATLTFATRGGRKITMPNAPGARVPVYEVFAEDAYRLRWFLGSLIERPIHGLDIGAHVGTFTCALTQVHPQVTLDSFEPAPDTVQFLRVNIECNGLSERVTVHECALAGETGFAIYDIQGAGSGLNGLVQGGASTGTATKVATVAFDKAVADAKRTVRFVKMDCEGGEYELVYRSSPDTWASVRRLVLEYHAVAGQSWPELRAWFANVGLDVVRDEPVNVSLGTAWLSRDPLA